MQVNDPTRAIAALRRNPTVVSAVSNRGGDLNVVSPSDPYFDSQSNLKQVLAHKAWAIARGTGMIAVIDTGVDYNHEDLAGKVIKGCDYADEDNDPMDEYGHGTHVAGIAAASTNNGTGVAGMSWNSTIYAEKVFHITKKIGADDEWDSIGATGISSSILASTIAGAKVVNLSLSNKDPESAAVYCPAIILARAMGAVVVAAAGNDYTKGDRWPGACPDAIRVASVDGSDKKSDFSNYGPTVDIAANGHKVRSTVPIGDCEYCNQSGYTYLPGTSMATPHVAGAAALLIGRAPHLTSSQVSARLIATAKPLAAKPEIGGRLDAYEAVFDGSFEDPNSLTWIREGMAASVTAAPGVMPVHRNRMAYLTTGEGSVSMPSAMRQKFSVQPGVSSLTIKLRYAFVTHPNASGNPSFEISMTSGAKKIITSGSRSSVILVQMPGGNANIAWTGWRTVTMSVPVQPGDSEFRIAVQPGGDRVNRSSLLVDAIEFVTPFDIAIP